MDQPNVLLVVLDSVRTKNLGLYGYHRDTTPFLTEYADEATVYTEARAPGIHSVASHASLWTGMEVEQHRIINHEDELTAGTTIWEELAETGYETGIFTTNPVVAHASNLASFFHECVTEGLTDHDEKLFADAHGPTDVARHEGVVGNLRRCIADDYPLRSLLNSGHHFYRKKRGELTDEKLSSTEIIDEFVNWIDERDRSWAACINLMDAHFPYEPSRSHDLWGGEKLRMLHRDLTRPPANEFIQERPWWQLEAFEHLYDGTIRELDNHVKRIVTELEQRNAHEDTLVVVTSDHGEGFGERSDLNSRTRLVDHSWGIDEVLTHVPLVVKYPGQSQSKEIDSLATLCNFPSAVKRSINESRKKDPFIADSPVVSSTYRLQNEDSEIFKDSNENVSDYIGPWRAVYMELDEDVYKYSTRKEMQLVQQVGTTELPHTTREEVKRTAEHELESLGDEHVKKDSAVLSDTVEDRLQEIGYLR